MPALLFACALAPAASQEKVVSGIVTDAGTDEPLPGVTIIVKETPTVGTITDLDGNYTISVANGATLVFSYLGYDTCEAVANKGVLNARLSPQTFAIEEVLVVGTRMRKSDLTGAVSGISSKQLREVPTTDLSVAMQGKVPGLYVSRSNASPGGDVQIRVRGINSINYGQDPVYVVDGMEVEDALRLINPDDIESIEVLKDASSTALYGARASNGVIVITTKKGKKGEGKINYSGFVSVSTYQNRTKRLNARQLYDLRIDAYANGYMDLHPDADRAAYINNYLTIADASINKAFSMEELYNGQNNITSDWVGELLRTGYTQNHALNFSGATDKTTYYLGFSYSDENGVLKNAGYTRYSGKISLDQVIKPWLRVGTNTIVSQGNRSVLEGDAYDKAFFGNPMQTIDTERPYMEWGGVSSMDSYNPLLSLDIDREEVHNRILSSNYAEINPLKNLYIRTTFSVDMFNRQDNRYTPSYTGQSLRDNYGGIAWQWRGNDLNLQWDNSISYEHTFAEKHRLLGLFSMSVQKRSANNNDVQVYGFPIEDFGFHNMGFFTDKERVSVASNYKSSSLLSFIGRINYSYEQKYFLTATVRRDGSSRFDVSNRWGTFPSFSAAWNIKEETFMENASWLNLLKLRAGFGIIGNQNIPDYAYLTIFNPVYSAGNIGLEVDDKRLENKDVKWEKQKQWNIGLEASLWNDRLSFNFDAFYMVNSDLLMKMNLYPSSGYDYQIANVAELENKGVEFSFNAQLIRTKDFTWSLSGNISHDKNKILKLYDDQDVIWNGGVTGREGHLFVDESLNSIYAYELDKIAQVEDMAYVNSLKRIEGGYKIRPGDYLPADRNNDGEITYLGDMGIVGKKDPLFYGGFSTYLGYKGFSFEAVFNYSYGAKRTSWAYDSMMSGRGDGVASIAWLDRWTPENPSTTMPRAWHVSVGAAEDESNDVVSGEKRYSFNQFDISALDASFLRCSAMTLSYSLPNKWISKFADNLRIYASGNNLFILTNYKGYDPESGEAYPLTRSFTVGLNVTF